MATFNEFGEIIRDGKEEQVQEQMPTFTPPKAQSFKESLKVKIDPKNVKGKKQDEKTKIPEKQTEHEEER